MENNGNSQTSSNSICSMLSFKANMPSCKSRCITTNKEYSIVDNVEFQILNHQIRIGIKKTIINMEGLLMLLPKMTDFLNLTILT